MGADLEGLSPHQLTPNVLLEFKQVRDLDRHYCFSWMKRMIIIRAPKSFTTIWSMIKGLFDTGVPLIIADSPNYLDVLDKYVDLNILPPCIYEKGEGRAVAGFSNNLDGGMVPEKTKLNCA